MHFRLCRRPRRRRLVVGAAVAAPSAAAVGVAVNSAVVATMLAIEANIETEYLQEPAHTVCNEGIEVPGSTDRSLAAARPCDSSQRPSAAMCAAALPWPLALSFPTPLPQPEKSGFMS